MSPINQLDQAVADLTADNAANPTEALDRVIREQRDGQAGRTRQVLGEVEEISPDRQAEILTLSQTTGLPAAVVRRNFDAIKKNAAAAARPVGSIQRESPALAKMLADPEQAALVQDDVEPLGMLEWWATSPRRALKEGNALVRFANLRSESLFRNLTSNEGIELEALRQEMTPARAEDGWFKGAVTGSMRLLPTIYAATREGLSLGIPAAVTAGTGAALVGQAGPQVFTPEEIVTVPTAFAAGMTAGTIVGGAQFGFRLEAGLAYDEFLDIKDELGNPIDPEVARIAAMATGTMNAGLEALGVGILFRSFPGVQQLRGALTRDAVKQALRSPTVRAALLRGAGTFGKTLTQETAVEVGQRAITIMSGELAKVAAETEEQQFAAKSPSEVLADLGQEATGALEAFALISLPGPVARVALDVRRARQAVQNEAYFLALGEGISQSKTVQRMPAAAQAFLEEATKDGAVPIVYAPVETWTAYWQSKGLDPAEMATAVTGDSAAYEDAVNTGEDLAIPTAAYAVQLAGTEHNAALSRELRLAPDQMNVREAEAFTESMDAAGDEVGPSGPETVAIREDIVEKLTQAGFEATAADRLGSLYESSFRALAGRAGVDPAELAARYDLQVRRAGVTPSGVGVEDTFLQSPDQRLARIDASERLSDEVETFAREVETDLGLQDFDLATFGDRHPNVVLLDLLRVPKPERKTGVGSKAMERLVDFADKRGLTIILTPASAVADETTSRSRLVKFYKRFGFRENRGRNVDFALPIQGGMRRLPAPRRAVQLPTPPGVGEFAQAAVPTAELRDLGAVEPGDIAELLQRITDGGFTYRVADGLFPATGLSVSVAGVSGVKFHIDDLTQDQLIDFVTAHAQELSAPQTHFGAWYNKRDEATGTGDDHVYLDIAKVVTDAQDAQDIGFAEDQIAYFNLETFEEVVIDYPPGHQHGPNWQGEGGAFAVEPGLPDRGVGGEALRGADRQDDVAGEARGDAGPPGRGETQRLDVFAQSPIPTPQQPRLARAPAEVVNGRLRVSTRVPSAPAAPAREEVLRTDHDAVNEPGAANFRRRAAAHYRATPLVRPTDETATDDEATLAAAVDTMVGNLRFLWDASAPEVRDRARQWYVGGHRIAQELADTQGISLNQAAAVIAVNSPQKDWNINISLAQRAVVIAEDAESRNRFFTPKLFEHYVERATVAAEVRAETIRKRSGGAGAARYLENKVAALARDREVMFNRRWRTLDVAGQARLLRAIDETENDPGFNIYSPEGDVVRPATVQAGTPASIIWSAYATIENTIAILDNGTIANIDVALGDQHKGRSFFANIADPTNPNAVTIDTHSVAASHLSPFGATTVEVKRTLSGAGEGSSRSAQTGLSGFSAVVGEAHFQLAATLSGELGETVLPREVQSVTWEAVRGLFSRGQKQDAGFVAGIAGLWVDWQGGKIGTGEELRDAISSAAGGVRPPDWADTPARVADDQGQLPAGDVPPGRPGVPARPGDAGVSAAALAGADAVGADGLVSPTGDVFFQPASRGNRGRIRFGDHRVEIDLLEDADASTFLHELGHFYLRVLTDLTATLPDVGERTAGQASLANDLATTLGWLGVKSAEAIGVSENEQFARGFEAYLREGRAPSAELRAAFARFRAWLVGIYRELTALEVNLTDEVRGVMDRLVASDDAIALAAAESEVTPMFRSADAAGMTDEEFVDYQDVVREATLKAQEELQGRLLREHARELKSERTAIEAEVSAKVFAMPAYQALSAIRTAAWPDGTPLVEGSELGDMRLDKQAIIAICGVECLAELPRSVPPLWKAEGGQDPTQVGEQFGFATGDEMLQALRGLPPMGQAIREQTDRLMAERFGGTLTDGKLADVAQAAVSGEHRQEVVRAELDALTKAMQGRIIPPASVINEAARKRIAGQRIRDITPGRYLQAARRSSQRAFSLVARLEDRTAAVDAKLQELINLALYREAERVRDMVDTRVRWVRDRNSARARARTAKSGALEQWDALLAQYEFSVQTLRALDRRQTLREWAASQEAAGLPVDLPDEVLDATRRVNYKELTAEEFTGVTDALRQLIHLSRLKNRLLDRDEKRTLDALAEDLASSIALFRTGRPRVPLERSPADIPRQATENFFAWQRKLSSLVRQADGGHDNGPMWQAIMRPLNAASDREQVLREEATEAFVKMLEGFDTDDLVDLSVKRAFPVIGESISRAGRIVVALNWGNAMNRQRLLDGRGWSTEQALAIINSLDAKDWRFVQAVWTQVNSYWPAIEAKQKRVYGVAPEKVEALPFETEFGTMPGGYFPIKFDPNDDKAYADSVKDIAEAMGRGAATIATTRRGHTKARMEVVKRPIWIDLNVVWQHSAEVIHDITHHEALSDVSRILRHKAVAGAIKEHQGVPVYRAMQDAVTDIAAGTIPVEHHGERAMGWLLAGTSIARMGWNVMTATVQPLGLTVSMVRVGPAWVGRGMAEWLGDAVKMENTVKRVHGESTFMASRHRTLIREIAEIQGRIRPRGSFALASVGGRVAGAAGARAGFQVASKYALIEDTYFYFISRAQMIADIPTWLGAKQKALNDAVSEERAIALADQAVIDSQGSGLIKDLAKAQRGSPALKIWTQFMGYFSVVFNQGAEAMKRRQQRNDPISRMRLAADILLLYTVPMVLESALRDALRDEDEDDDSLLFKLAREQLSYIMATVVFARELGGAVEGFRYGGPAGSGFFDESTRLIVELQQGELDVGLLKAVNQVGGILFHYPATEVERLARAVIAAGKDPSAAFSALYGGRPE